MESRIQNLYNSLKGSVFKKPADTPAGLRQAILKKVQSIVTIGASEPLPSPVLNKYVEKIAHNAYKVIDQDIEKLKAEGLSEAEIFELTIAASWAAGTARFDRGLEVLKSVPS